jgi:hypothetical protein
MGPEDTVMSDVVAASSAVIREGHEPHGRGVFGECG